MKRFICMICAVVCFLTVGFSSASARHVRNNGVKKIFKAFKKAGPVELVDFEYTKQWFWAELAVMDELYPLTVDILADSRKRPQKIAFMVAPAGFNFRNNYFSPRENNPAQFLRENGYLVVGITFREDQISPDDVDESVADWGIAKHVDDMRKIIKPVTRALRLPYDLIGQSSGGVCILDYASKYSHPNFERIVLIDTDSFDPAIQPEKVMYAGMTHDAFVQLMAQGMLVESFGGDLKELAMGAAMFPDADSGQPRPGGLPGNFTLSGLLHFSLINTGLLPGVTSPITGLPGEWVLVKGVCDGYYNFHPDPLLDDFALTKTDVQVFSEMAAEIGSGSTALAFAIDAYALLALNGAYTIDWSGIDETVVMVNGELSSGSQTYYGTRIINAGNSDVSIVVVPEYGYADLMWGTNAEQDVWQNFVE